MAPGPFHNRNPATLGGSTGKCQKGSKDPGGNKFMARKRGCRVYVGDEVRQAEMGRIEAQIGELAAKLKALKKSRITG